MNQFIEIKGWRIKHNGRYFEKKASQPNTYIYNINYIKSLIGTNITLINNDEIELEITTIEICKTKTIR